MASLEIYVSNLLGKLVGNLIFSIFPVTLSNEYAIKQQAELKIILKRKLNFYQQKKVILGRSEEGTQV